MSRDTVIVSQIKISLMGYTSICPASGLREAGRPRDSPIPPPARFHIQSRPMSSRLNAAIFGVILFCTATMQGADRVKVTILEQKDNQSQYDGVIPGHTNATSNTNVNCAEYGSNVNCNGTTNTHATSTPARRVSYGVSGASLSLLLPDGRIALVNCDSKYAMKGDYVNR